MATKTTEAQESGRNHKTTTKVRSDGAGGEYCAEGTDREMEESATEEEYETAGGAVGIIETWTAMAQGSQGSGVGPLTGGTAAVRGNTWVVTFASAYETGMGGRHGARPREMEMVSRRQENLASESSGVRDREGVRKASRVAGNPGGDRQGVGGGVESL